MKLYSSITSPIEVPIDEYIFHGVLKKGRIVSGPTELYAEAIDFSKACFVFRMSLLESSIISESWPEFDTKGILGQWRLMTNGFLKLVQISDLRDPKEIKLFLKDSHSNILFSQHY